MENKRIKNISEIQKSSQMEDDQNPFKYPPERSKKFIFWIFLIVVLVIIISMVYLFFSPPFGNENKPLEEVERLDKMEEAITSWLTASIFILTLGIVIKGFEKYSIYFSLSFIIIGIIMLIMANVNFLTERSEIKSAGYQVRPRMNILFLVILALIVVALIIVYDIIVNDILIHKQNKTNNEVNTKTENEVNTKTENEVNTKTENDVNKIDNNQV